MPRRALVVGSLVVSTLFAHNALAQSAPTDDHAPSGTMLGLSVGVPGYQSKAAPELLVLGLSILDAKPSKMGVEFSVGTIPRLLSGQAVIFGGRLNAVLPLTVTPDFWLMPSGGGSLIGGTSPDGGGALAGLNAGVGTILWNGNFGLRTNVTWHHFLGARGAIWLAEFGFVEGR